MNNFSENVDISIKLNNIFKKRFDIDLFSSESDININDNLLGENFRLTAGDLIYLLYDVEEEFNIIVSEEDIDNIKFNTINNIITIINNKSQQNQREVG